MKNIIKFWFISVLPVITILIILAGCQSKYLTLTKNHPLFIQQDLSVLNNTNGKILQQKYIEVDSEYRNKVDCYKIRYVSDGLEVVGFIVKPKELTSKYPVIIFNRGGNREYFKITGKTLKYLSYLASKNYVILASQYRGNDGGQGHEEFGLWRRSDYSDGIEWVRPPRQVHGYRARNR